MKNLFSSKYKKLINIPFILLAAIINIFVHSFYKRKCIILVGGHCGEMYQDNSAAIHQYLLSKHANVEVYWMMSKHGKITGISGNISKLGSIRNYILYLNAKACYFSHSLDTDIAPLIDKLLPQSLKPIRVNISHGIEGLKKNIYYKNLEKVDYYICSSNTERKIKRTWEIPSEKLIVTGVPRFDRLFQHMDKTSSKTILYLPTWREWLYQLDNQDFINSNFASHLIQILSNVNLNNILLEKSFKLKIMLHPFMNEKIKAIQQIGINKRLSNIELLNGSQYIADEVLDSSLLITDYSSVCWDFLFLNKPVIFYQFDQQEYLQKRGSYIDLNRELFGETVYDIKSLIITISQYLAGDYKVVSSDHYQEKKRRYIPFVDDHNCERVINQTLFSV